VRILDLAREMIRLTGYEPDRDIEIRITGTRPGEKLFEELGSDSEGLDKTRHPKILIGRIAGLPAAEVRRILGDLAVLVAQGDARALRVYLAEALPENRLASAAPVGTAAATSR
jgi:FlaA1/EpsC-like NDP-sugar epimerase